MVMDLVERHGSGAGNAGDGDFAAGRPHASEVIPRRARAGREG